MHKVYVCVMFIMHVMHHHLHDMQIDRLSVSECSKPNIYVTGLTSHATQVFMIGMFLIDNYWRKILPHLCSHRSLCNVMMT